MSTIYCPVCWELLVFLTKQPTAFTVRARHITLSRVELPPWLPDDVMMEMLDRFKVLLLGGIAAVVTEQGTKRLARKPLQRQSAPNSIRRHRSPDSLYSDSDD
jgi:hypothetical protein